MLENIRSLNLFFDKLLSLLGASIRQEVAELSIYFFLFPLVSIGDKGFSLITLLLVCEHFDEVVTIKSYVLPNELRGEDFRDAAGDISISLCLYITTARDCTR